MEIKDGRISILINQKETRIELYDDGGSRTFAKIILTPEQLSSVLSRLANVPCKIEVNNLDKIGKKMIHKQMTFPIPNVSVIEEKKEATKRALKVCPKDWIPDLHFDSQTPFFWKSVNGKAVRFAQTAIRKWIKIKEKK